ncbi:MAG: S8 family serine peptidase [Polyangiaceae bacterium]
MPKKRRSLQVRHLDIEPLWEVTRGEGVRVAVLDTGIITSPALPPERVSTMAADGSPQRATADLHGTYCASVIGSSKRGAEGMAPRAELVGIQVSLASGSPSLTAVKAGLARAIDEECDVISCSFVLDPIDQELRDLVRSAHDQGRPLVAAAGNVPSLASAFPEQTAHAIVVSALDRDGQPLPTRRTQWTDIDALGDRLSVVDGEGYPQKWHGQTSGAAAIVSGVLALAIATVPRSKRRKVGLALEGLLKRTAHVSGSSEDPIRRIQPKKLVEMVKKVS